MGKKTSDYWFYHAAFVNCIHPVVTSEGKPDLIIKNTPSYYIDGEMKYPDFYSGFVWRRYTNIERSFLGIEVWCNMGEIKFCSFYNVQYLDIYFFFGIARDGVIFRMVFHTLVW